MKRILAACDKKVREAPPPAKPNSIRLRSLILLLRYSGLRIGDAVSLSTDRLKGNRLFLYTAKTNTPVHLILPKTVVLTLQSTPRTSEQYWFWTGRGKLETCSKDWQAKLSKLFKSADIENGHAHRMKDTFSVELLLAGVLLERLSVLLGHQSIQVTERHYAPWAKERQDQLDADLQKAWKRDRFASGRGYRFGTVQQQHQ